MIKLSDIINSPSFYDISEEYDIFEHEYLLNEGLIKTWPIEKTVSVLKRAGIECDQYNDMNVFNILVHTDDAKNIKTVNQALTLANNLGWFPSYVYYIRNDVIVFKNKYELSIFKKTAPQYDSVMIRFEAKYDVIVETIPRYLYHVTSNDRAIKIMSVGLLPKSNSITSSHPPRVYLSKSATDAERMVNRNPNFWAKSRDGKFTILEIDTNKIPSYFKIYRDPNALGHAYFTLNTIPKNAIELKKTFDININ